MLLKSSVSASLVLTKALLLKHYYRHQGNVSFPQPEMTELARLGRLQSFDLPKLLYQKVHIPAMPTVSR